MKDYFRLAEYFLLASILSVIVFNISPQEIGVLVYKLAVVSGFGYLGYTIYRSLGSDGSRVSDLASGDSRIYAFAILARALLVSASMIAGALAI